MVPVTFPNSTRVANWNFSGLTKDVRLGKGETVKIDNPRYQLGWNLGSRCL
jgi:hypothetical protein